MRATARMLGRGLLRLARRTWPAAVARWPADAQPPRALVLGAIAAETGLPAVELARVVAYDDVQTVLAAALKLLPLDPADATAWCVELLPDVDRLADEVSTLTATRRHPGDRFSTDRGLGAGPRPHHQEVVQCLTPRRALRLGVCGPVGTGKSSLIATICRELAGSLRLAVVTNDIYTDEDARFLRSAGVLPEERIVGVETGACPHTAIRDDVTANLMAVEDLEERFAPLDVVLVESGGDNLTATFSPALVDVQVFVLDVAGGGDVARKGGPGIERADLLVVNKTDLAPYVAVDVARMVHDAEHARAGRPVLSAVPLRSRVHGRAGGVGHRAAGPVPLRPAGAGRPRPDGSACPRALTPPPALRSAPATCAPSPSDRLRVALVPEQAVLLAGDHVEVTVRVGRGAALEIVEPGGTVAYAMRGRQARWDVPVEVEDGGSLVWRGEPFVVARRRRRPAAHGSRSWRRHPGSCSARRSSSVAQARDRARSCHRTDVHRDGVPVLVEELDAALGLGPHRVLDQGLCLGSGCTADGLALESGDRLHRWLGAETHASPISVCQSSPSAE